MKGCHAGGRAGLNHGFRDVFGAFEEPANVNAGPAGGHRAESGGFGEIIGIELDPQETGKRFELLGNAEPGRQNHHVESVAVKDAVVIRRIGHGQGVGFGGREDAVGPAAHEADAVHGLGLVQVALVVFAEGAHVHEKNGRFDAVLESLLGDDGLFQGEHAARAGAVGHGPFLKAPGTDTLDPSDLAGHFAVRGPHQLAQGGAGGRQDALVLEAGHHIRLLRIPEIVQPTGVEQGGPGRQDNRPEDGLHGLFRILRQNRPGRTGLNQGVDVGACVHVD